MHLLPGINGINGAYASQNGKSMESTVGMVVVTPCLIPAYTWTHTKQNILRTPLVAEEPLCLRCFSICIIVKHNKHDYLLQTDNFCHIVDGSS